jgi:hypothetical protein
VRSGVPGGVFLPVAFLTLCRHLHNIDVAQADLFRPTAGEMHANLTQLGRKRWHMDANLRGTWEVVSGNNLIADGGQSLGFVIAQELPTAGLGEAQPAATTAPAIAPISRNVRRDRPADLFSDGIGSYLNLISGTWNSRAEAVWRLAERSLRESIGFARLAVRDGNHEDGA